MRTDPGRRRPTPVGVLLAVGSLLVCAAVVLGVLDVRAGARDEARTTALAAARVHLVDLGAASVDPTARAHAVDGATGAWRERLTVAAATGSTSTVVRSVGLEEFDAGSARVLAVGLVAGSGGARPFRATLALTRVDDRWLVADVGELP